MAASTNDWLVEDSEDESIFELLMQDLPSASKTTRSTVVADSSASDAIQTGFSTLNRPRTPERGRQSPDGSLFTPPAHEIRSTTDTFADAPSTSGAPSAPPPKSKPRPRPRVVMKKAAPFVHNADVANTSFSHISDPPTSTTRTNDDIHSATVTPFGLSHTTDDAYSMFDIAERAKMRSRKSQTAKKSVHGPYKEQDIIELTSDEDDELTLKPTKRQKKQGTPAQKPQAPAKPRPKPTLRVKRPAVLPSDSPPNRTEPHDPPVPPAPLASSQLPMLTLPTIPPSTPPLARELSPLSSPPVTTRKRKRAHPFIADDDDEMDIIGGNPTRASPPSTGPPPFFASSASAPTDSGIEIPPVDSPDGRSKKASSSKKAAQTKKQNKGKKGKKAEMITVGEMVELSAGTTQEPRTPAIDDNLNPAEERRSPTTKKAAMKRPEDGRTSARSGDVGTIGDSCEEEELVPPPKSDTGHTPVVGRGEKQRSKESTRPHEIGSSRRDPPSARTSTADFRSRGFSGTPKVTPMSELIRRANSQPSSPFPNATRTYLPFLKSSRTMLSKIAPLHPNRRSPPPPLPRPPPPKKSKKQLEMEERIEEELAETVEGWSCLTDEERKALRKARIDAELGYE